MDESKLLLVTGATGLVGGAIARTFRNNGWSVRALVRDPAAASDLASAGIDLAPGTLTDTASLQQAATGVTHAVHCAAKVGDWGPVDDYRKVNVDGTAALANALTEAGSLKRFIHISSLGVYEARDHHGTDETVKPNVSGIDGYTLSKAESEQLIVDKAVRESFPAIILRPGFVYGPGDRNVIPRIVERIQAGQFAFLGSGDQLLNNIYVDNIVHAVEQAIAADPSHHGQVFNITDPRLVSKQEFVFAIADAFNLKRPQKHVPLPVAKLLASTLERAYRVLGKKQAPLLSKARYKFLGLNLDFSADKARRELGYAPTVDFTEGMATTLAALTAGSDDG